MVYVYALSVLCGIGGGFSILLLLAHRILTNYGECTVDINGERQFVIDGGCSVLEALYDNEIYIPSACGGQGTCGYCKVTVLSGGGPVLPTEMTFLSMEEQESGVRLACQVKIKENIAIRVRSDYLNVRKFLSHVSAVQMLTHDTRELILALDEQEEIAFIPGQYVQVGVPVKGGMEFRAYSIASTPANPREIILVVKLIPGGLGSTYLHSIQEGDEVIFTGPYGEFSLPDDPATEMICVAGGCGMAPVRSIIHHLAEADAGRDCWLFFGARARKDVFYEDEYHELREQYPGLRVHYALSEPDAGDEWHGETGFIHTLVDAHLDDGANRSVFLCGPPPMVDAAMEVLKAKGVRESNIFYDAF
jgi:Na+-transporting NADH:ubiquinone oxidoreductase subunit F